VIDDRRKLPRPGRSREHALAHLRRRGLRRGEPQPGSSRRQLAHFVRALLATSQVMLETIPLGFVVDAVERVNTGQDMQVGTE
jgi:hypothetical protein